MKTLDPVTLAVINGRLVQIADEMDATLYRSAFNPIIAEAHDACHGLYHAETGATLVQGTSGLPIFVGAMAFAVKAVIDKVARDSVCSPPPCGEGLGVGVVVVRLVTPPVSLAATPTPRPSPQGGGERTESLATLSITAFTANAIAPTKIGRPDVPCTRVAPVSAW